MDLTQPAIMVASSIPRNKASNRRLLPDIAYIRMDSNAAELELGSQTLRMHSLDAHICTVMEKYWW